MCMHNKHMSNPMTVRKMIQQMNKRQSRQYLQIYERIRDSTNFIQNQQRFIRSCHNELMLQMNLFNCFLFFFPIK